jgi:hypothetical protein
VKFIYSFIVTLFLCSVISAQDEPVKIEPADFTGSTINRTESYAGNSLWGYIDGGADLYLEYGFSKLTAQEISFQSNKYRVDIYRMNNAESAFGIFSISKFKCSEKTISKYSCVTEYQAMAAKGSYYISVTNEKGSAEEQKFTLSLAEKVLSRISEKDYDIPDFFRQDIYKNKEIKLVRGILGVQNAVADWEVLFDGIKDFTFHFCSVEEGGKYTVTALIKFRNQDDADLFVKNGKLRTGQVTADVSLSCSKISNTETLFTETNKKAEK